MQASDTSIRKPSNPFTPIFGKVPPYFAGRESIIDEISSVFQDPDNNPDRCTLFVGARGTGKTALLTHLGRIAEASGWICADVTASNDMLEEIRAQVERAAQHLIYKEDQRTITGLNIAGIGGISWSKENHRPETWRITMSDLLEKLSEMHCGLLITVDEVDPDLEAMERLVTTYQHFVREDRKVALFMAGLPHRINSLVSGDSTSFLRRAARYQLGSIPRYEVVEAFRLTVESGGKTIDDGALAYAADAIEGFPYLFQLVGYRSWNASSDHGAISLEHVQQGAKLAREELATRIFDATYSELSEHDKAFLIAMSEDEAQSKRSDLMQRLQKPSSHITVYKKRLIEQGIIEETPGGAFRFALPGFKEYIRGQARDEASD